MIALGRRSRIALAAASLASFAGAFGLMANGARGAADEAAAPVVLASPRPASERAVAVVPQRDPFAQPSAPAAGASALPAPALPDVPGALPPNLGAHDTPVALPPPPDAHVMALATGAHPGALLQEAAAVRLVTVGDRVGNATVAAIDPGGVRLSDGTTLAFGSASPVSKLTPPPPAMPSQPPVSSRTPPPPGGSP